MVTKTAKDQKCQVHEVCCFLAFLGRDFILVIAVNLCPMSASLSSGSSADHPRCMSTHSFVQPRDVRKTHFERFCLQFPGGDIRTAGCYSRTNPG